MINESASMVREFEDFMSIEFDEDVTIDVKSSSPKTNDLFLRNSPSIGGDDYFNDGSSNKWSPKEKKVGRIFTSFQLQPFKLEGILTDDNFKSLSPLEFLIKEEDCV